MYQETIKKVIGFYATLPPMHSRSSCMPRPQREFRSLHGPVEARLLRMSIISLIALKVLETQSTGFDKGGAGK